MCMQDFDHNGGQMDSERYLLGNVTEMRQTVILVAILSLDHIILITAYATYIYTGGVTYRLFYHH